MSDTKPKPYKKANIPKALREQVWLKYIGTNFESKCIIKWCKNRMTVFDFHVAHNTPESNGGKTDITNLRPLCARCNLSMGSKYTIDQWNGLELHNTPPEHTKTPWWICC